MTPLVRRLGSHPAIMPLTARVICARLVRESPSFFARELRRDGGSDVYTLRENGMRVAMRHAGTDVATLAEVFYRRYYEPPAMVASTLGSPRQILDLGANIGLFGAFALGRWPAAQVTAYEPDPDNASIHERTTASNDQSLSWTLIRGAAWDATGEVHFAAGLDVNSHAVGGPQEGPAETITVPAYDVLPQICEADLVKMDIEGGEWRLLADRRFAANPPRAMVLEYHPRGCPGDDPRAAVEAMLRSAGLQTSPIWHRADGHGMMWGWRD